MCQQNKTEMKCRRQKLGKMKTESRIACLPPSFISSLGGSAIVLCEELLDEYELLSSASIKAS